MVQFSDYFTMPGLALGIIRRPYMASKNPIGNIRTPYTAAGMDMDIELDSNSASGCRCFY
tara:strand:+ start:93 stop:272 length:180 start_codon:yes stop_codon:yes gene_type:complete